MKKINRPPTKSMIAQLRLARSKELSEHKNRIITSNDFKRTFKGLYQRGFVDVHKINVDGKEIEGVYVTLTGIRFLSQYEASVAKKKIAKT